MTTRKLKKVETVRVFLTKVNAEGGEGIVSTPTPGGLLPLVALDDVQYKAFSQMAQEMANESGRTIYVAEFTERVEGEKFEQKLIKEMPKVSEVDVPKIGSGGFKIGD